MKSSNIPLAGICHVVLFTLTIMMGPMLTAQKAGPVPEAMSLSHNFGEVIEGKIVRYTFMVKNAGDEDLMITNAKPSCGCVYAEFSKEAIPPGKSAMLSVTFDTKGRSGRQSKSIRVWTNASKEPMMFVIDAEVMPTEK